MPERTLIKQHALSPGLSKISHIVYGAEYESLTQGSSLKCSKQVIQAIKQFRNTKSYWLTICVEAIEDK